MSPGTAMASCRSRWRAAWLDFWLSVAGPELPNSSLAGFPYFTVNEIRMLCSALHHIDAVWRLGGSECLQVHFFQ